MIRESLHNYWNCNLNGSLNKFCPLHVFKDSSAVTENNAAASVSNNDNVGIAGGVPRKKTRRGCRGGINLKAQNKRSWMEISLNEFVQPSKAPFNSSTKSQKHLENAMRQDYSSKGTKRRKVTSTVGETLFKTFVRGVSAHDQLQGSQIHTQEPSSCPSKSFHDDFNTTSSAVTSNAVPVAKQSIGSTMDTGVKHHFTRPFTTEVEVCRSLLHFLNHAKCLLSILEFAR